jgi:hypothetical protein
MRSLKFISTVIFIIFFAVIIEGSDKNLAWHMVEDDLIIDELPDSLPCDHEWSFKIRIR